MGFQSFFFVMSILLGVSGCQTPPDPTPVGNPIWQTCKADTDCMELRGHCNTPHTVNKKFEDAFRKYKRASEKKVDCKNKNLATWPEVYHLSCLEARCQILELEGDGENDTYVDSPSSL